MITKFNIWQHLLWSQLRSDYWNLISISLGKCSLYRVNQKLLKHYSSFRSLWDPIIETSWKFMRSTTKSFTFWEISWSSWIKINLKPTNFEASHVAMCWTATENDLYRFSVVQSGLEPVQRSMEINPTVRNRFRATWNRFRVERNSTERSRTS